MPAKTCLRPRDAGKTRLFALLCGALLLGLSACATAPVRPTPSRLAMERLIQAEPPGDYFIGRRYFKSNFRFWGYVRGPGQPWNTATLVMLNENKMLAPDRSQLGPGTGSSYEAHAGFDHGYEYKLHGNFSGDQVYELVSNRVYPEFTLTGYELISTLPAPIFPSQLKGRGVSPLVIEKPE